MPRFLSPLLSALAVAAAPAPSSAPPRPTTEYSTDFGEAHDDTAWSRHAEGGGVCEVAEGVLELDLSEPVEGKHAWADLQRTLKLPMTIEWDQTTARTSPNFYLSGLTIRDARDTMVVAGLTGDSMKRVVHMAGRRGTQSLTVGTWYRFILRMSADKQTELTVTERETAREVAVLSGRLTQLRGPMVRIGFYHNQPRDQGPDRFAQDRGASRIDNLRVRAAAIDSRSMKDYRDPQVRGYDSRTMMTFNRTMRWLGPEQGVEGAVLAYDAAQDLFLTGNEQAAAWQENRGCRIEPKDRRASTFTRPNDLDGPDCVALRSFQWCVRQHPVLRYELRPTDGACWLKVTFVCPYLGDGIEVFRCQPRTGAQQGEVDLQAEMERRGLGYHQFGEMGVFVYQERPPDRSTHRGSCDVLLRLTGDGALLTTPPLVRTTQHAAEGVGVHAVLALADGDLAHADDVTVNGELAGRTLSFSEVRDTGVFRTCVRDIEEGEHTVQLRGEDARGRVYRTQLSLTIVPGAFAAWRPGHPTYQLPDGRVLPTQFGDLLAWVPMLDPGSSERRPIASGRQWTELSDTERARVRLIKLRTLNPAEIAGMLREQAGNGISTIRLTPNVSPHESYLDAGGHVSMHGLETLLAVLAECRRAGIRAVINLFHYPYWSPSTGAYPPWRQYAEAGYSGAESFHDPVVGAMLRRYMQELLLFVREDPAVLGYSLTGENDQAHGSEWINSMFAHVMACDPNHMVTQEQGGGAERCSGGTPWGYEAFRPTRSAGLGYRTYYTGGVRSDVFFMVCGRFYRANPPVFVAEVASGPGWHGGFAANWLHPDFVTKVRDTCWAALLTQQTMCLTWSAPWTQEERLVPRRCADRLDWSTFRRQRPAVGLQVDRVDDQVLRRLADYETALARLGVDYDYVWTGQAAQEARDGYAVLLDAGGEFAEPNLPPDILAARPVVASEGFSVSYLASADARQLIALVKNTAEYRLGPGYGRGVKELHRQRTRPAPLRVRLRAVPAGCSYAVYDLEGRRIIKEGRGGQALELDLGVAAHDVAIVVAP